MKAKRDRENKLSQLNIHFNLLGIDVSAKVLADTSFLFPEYIWIGINGIVNAFYWPFYSLVQFFRNLALLPEVKHNNFVLKMHSQRKKYKKSFEN